MKRIIRISKKVFLALSLSIILFGLIAPSGVKAGASTGFRVKNPLPNGAYTCQGYGYSDYSPTGKYQCVLYGIDAEVTRRWTSYAGTFVTTNKMAVSPYHNLWSPQVWLAW